MKKTVIDAQADSKGNITKVRFKGNVGFTPLKTAMDMADRGEIKNAHSVRPSHAKPHLRTNPDNQHNNNLDHMAGDD